LLVGGLSSVGEVESPPLNGETEKRARDSKVAACGRSLDVPSHQLAAGRLRKSKTEPEMGITRHHSLGWVRRAARDGPGHESEFHHG
jgi:hypothetical protein